MFAYNYHIGDFNKKTRHLSRVERSIYRDLIDLYYESETPLANDIPKLCRLVLAYSDEEKRAVSQVLEEFFALKPEGYVHERCEQEIKKFYEMLSKKSAAGKASADRRKQARDEKIEQRTAQAQQNSTGVEHVNNECSTDEQQASKPVSQLASKPENISATPLAISPKSAGVPVQEIVELFNKKFPELAQVQKITDKRRSAIRQRWKTNLNLQSLDRWDRFFEYIRQSDFLMGRTQNPWHGFCFDWLITESNFVKTLEGNYHAKGAA